MDAAKTEGDPRLSVKLKRVIADAGRIEFRYVRDNPYLNATASGGPQLSLEHSPDRAGNDGPAFAAPSYTIIEFCEVERMSRSALYKLWAQGKGPRFYFVGNTRRITAQARLDYHRDREAAAAVEMAAKP